MFIHIDIHIFVCIYICVCIQCIIHTQRQMFYLGVVCVCLKLNNSVSSISGFKTLN